MQSQATGKRNGTSGGSGTNRLGAGMERVGNTAQDLWSAVRESMTDVRESLDLEGRVRRNPYRMIGAAIGVGYVLGGGLFSRLTGRIFGVGLRMGLKLAALPFLREELLGAAEEVASVVEKTGDTHSGHGKSTKAEG